MRDDICVCCGAYVPEGRQVCYDCEREVEYREKHTVIDGDSTTTTILTVFKQHPVKEYRFLNRLKRIFA